jgi:hypothetical protein
MFCFSFLFSVLVSVSVSVSVSVYVLCFYNFINFISIYNLDNQILQRKNETQESL